VENEINKSFEEQPDKSPVGGIFDDLIGSPDQSKLKLTKKNSSLIVAMAGIVSWLITNFGQDYDRMELGALIPIFLPAIVAVIGYAVFIFIDWLFPKIRIISVAIIVCTILVFGYKIRLLCS
jgi:hypothetical protein